MTASLPKEPSTRKLRADALAILVMGVIASASTIYLAVKQYQSFFVPGGVMWNLPVETATATGTGLAVYSASGAGEPTQVTGTFTHLQVLVPNLNPVSAVCLVLFIGVAAVAALIAIACVVRLAWLFQQGHFFTMQASRTLRAFTWTLLGGGLITSACFHLAANGVEGALQVQATAPEATEWWAWYWIALFVATASGLIDIALRLSLMLQHETEGLI